MLSDIFKINPIEPSAENLAWNIAVLSKIVALHEDKT